MTHPPKTEQDFVATPALLEIVGRIERLSEGPKTLFDEDRVEIWLRATGEEIKRWNSMLAAAPAQVSAEEVERLRGALKRCVSFISMMKDEGVELFGTGVHTGLRKGTEAPNAMELWRFIADSKTTAWPDALEFALDPFFSMWGGDEALASAISALSHPASPVTDPFAGVEVEGE